MPVTTLSSRQFNQEHGKAKRAADTGPVVITDRGQPTHVLLSFEEYTILRGKEPSIAEALAMKGGDDIEFDPPKLDIELRIPDLS